ncbi:iron-sulfur cluster assembly [Micractinium conductrix]|uniref:Iron-sulfur cluster assembly n=1 Tax=Micractinium conductrix TaxID=554055 RepID=A0A2P6V165_9CHLO|nr:iron-sulfur cluster assembly [Micractinium conductrix]PSC67855.1 iron-sulfur cluster assembly [Micractinium conductrix]PSC71899.1 iron-sulfur cluster assembly [Micractinium conductrix]|eukprot:PSC67830.1 iron-sulfur cluster assembly [Micractinium conductrix]
MRLTSSMSAVPAAQRPATALRTRSAFRPARPLLLKLRAAAVEGAVKPLAPAITLTDRALEHLTKLRSDSGGEKLLLRMGVKSGGCSGMSYVMDFESEENIKPDDAVMEYEGGFKLVTDPKSLLYLFGMHLDWSPALIGGGFQFQNPNAADSCGCGKSFGV